MDIKERTDRVVAFIESCWDENQEADDGLTFDERVKQRLGTLSDEEREIVEDAIIWCEE